MNIKVSFCCHWPFSNLLLCVCVNLFVAEPPYLGYDIAGFLIQYCLKLPKVAYIPLDGRDDLCLLGLTNELCL